MGRDNSGAYHPHHWTPPDYLVDDDGKVVGGYSPEGPNNWGRWGADDKLGTLNLITADDICDAARLVNSGKVFSLSIPIEVGAPRSDIRAAPVHYFSMTGSDVIAGTPNSAIGPGVAFTDDYIHMALQESTQWDGFAHWPYRDTFYNGYWAGNVTAAGSVDLEMSTFKDKFVGRGILLDVARFLGVDHVVPGTPITAAMLDDVAASQKLSVRRGDIAVVRTGHLGRWYTLSSQEDKADWLDRAPGLSITVIPWLSDHDVAAVAIDTIGAEVFPHEETAHLSHPIHTAALVDLGLPLGELWWLEELGTDCASDGQYAFLLCAPTLNIPGSVGSVVNPIAIK